MAKTTRSISLDSKLDDEIRIAAAKARMTISRFLVAAAKDAMAKQKRRNPEDVAA